MMGWEFMSIAIITPGVFPVPPIQGGSVEIVVNGLGNELAKHVRTLIFSRKIKQLATIKKHGKRIDIRIPFKSANQYLHEIDTYIAAEKPTCIQIENRPLYIPHFKKKWPHIKLILSLHSLTFITSLTNIAALQALSQADLISVNSRFISQEIRKLFPTLTTDIVVNHAGVDESVFMDRFSTRGESLRSYYRNRYNLQGKQVLLFVGRLIPEKGLHLLLESLPALIEKHPDIHLVIVGTSHYGRQLNTVYVGKLKSLIRPIAKYVTYANHLPPKVMPQMYHVADIVVTPSIGKEALCLVNLEASISGIPVISTEVGGIPEVITHGYNGFLINPTIWKTQFEQYATMLLDHKELNESMGKNGQTLAQKQFTWKKSVLHYLRSYRQLMIDHADQPLQINDQEIEL